MIRNSIVLSLSILAIVAVGHAAPSKPKAQPKKPEIVAFNEGTELLFALEFAAAATYFEKAITVDPKMAAAHNNLAYVLRKQGSDFYEPALASYNRAIELDPELAEAYMYRGVLYIQMGKKNLALEDHAVLLDLDSKLAEKLEQVITTGAEREPEQFFGVVGRKK